MYVKSILGICIIILTLIIIAAYLAKRKINSKKDLNIRRANKISDIISYKIEEIENKKMIEEQKNNPDYDKIDYYITYLVELDFMHKDIVKRYNNKYHTTQ